MTKLSVVLVCYNEGPYIGEAVRSVLAQTRSDLIEKIVIVDDGSAQPTLDILAGLTQVDPRLTLCTGAGKGPAAGRNLGVRQCTSDWIAMLDGDDLWEPEKIERQIALIEKEVGIGLVYTGLASFSDADPMPRVAAVADLSKAADLEEAYFLKDGPITSTIMVKRALFEKVGGYNEALRVFEDTDFYARLAAVTRFGFLKEVLVRKRQHARSITSKRKDMIAHQAFVAVLIASRTPRLVRLLPRRLSRAARKLGNSEIAVGDSEAALVMYRMAVAFDPFSLLAWLSQTALRLGLPLGAIRKWVISRRKASFR